MIANRWDIDGPLCLYWHVGTVPGGRAHPDPLCIAKDWDIGVVCREQELPLRFRGAQLLLRCVRQ